MSSLEHSDRLTLERRSKIKAHVHAVLQTLKSIDQRRQTPRPADTVRTLVEVRTTSET